MDVLILLNSSFSDRRVSLEDRFSASPSFLKSPSINSKDLCVEGTKELNNPRIIIAESKDCVAVEIIKPGSGSRWTYLITRHVIKTNALNKLKTN